MYRNCLTCSTNSLAATFRARARAPHHARLALTSAAFNRPVARATSHQIP